MSEMSAADADLAHRVHSGDTRAEAELFTRFRGGIHQIVRRVTGSYALADELTQDTLIVTLRRLRSEPLAEPAKLAAFVAQTARNLAIAERRKALRRRTESGTDEIEEVADMAPDQADSVEADSAATAVRSLLKELRSERDRRILVRHYLDGDDKAEICREWGITESVFHVILFRARKRFLELLDKRGISRIDLFSFVLI